ncbi:MAG: hypothetical protein AAF348_18860 [Bacteroidota bacterium]
MKVLGKRLMWLEVKGVRRKLASYSETHTFEQRTTNNEQRTTNNEQRTTNNEQRTTNNEQRTTNNEQQNKCKNFGFT